MKSDAAQTVGFIGLGRMGIPMCRRLIDAGHALVVFNRTAAKAAPLVAAGARLANSLPSLAASCDIIITCLDTVDASEAVWLGTDGLVAHARPNALLIDHATITPTLAVRIGESARARVGAPIGRSARERSADDESVAAPTPGSRGTRCHR